MKRVLALGSFSILFWVFSGVAAAQSLSGLTGPLDEVVDTVTRPVDKVTAPVDKVKEVVDEVTKPVTEALPAPIKNPVDNVVKDVGKAVDTVVKDVTNAGNKTAVPATNVPDSDFDSGGNLNNATGSAPAPGRSTNRSAPRSLATKTKAARTEPASRHRASRGFGEHDRAGRGEGHPHHRTGDRRRGLPFGPFSHRRSDSDVAHPCLRAYGCGGRTLPEWANTFTPRKFMTHFRQHLLFAGLFVIALIVQVAILVWFLDERKDDDPVIRGEAGPRFGETIMNVARHHLPASHPTFALMRASVSL